ncbi:MAG: hypothetical protein NTW86_19555, partial [Candidatus Sumerlaeota bacterium]|nr:hypothetical protein [Candidatus Sumerlaeota bacterium]
SLFESNGQLWADETRVRWRGAHQGARIESTGAPPPEAPQARLAGPPRQPGSRTLLAGAFASLADLPGLGFLAV